jgi:hypothetical protein
MRNASTGYANAIIIEEDVNGLPRILRGEEEEELKASLHSEGAELVAGMQRWVETLHNLGGLTTGENIRPTVDHELWEAIEEKLKDGSYDLVHAIPLKGAHSADLNPYMTNILTSLHHHILAGGSISIENQATSTLWIRDYMTDFMAYHKLHSSTTDKCKWGLGSQERTKICSNIPKPSLRQIEQAKCQCDKPHVVVTSRYDFQKEAGWICNRATTEPPHLAAAIAEAHHHAWTTRPEKTGIHVLEAHFDPITIAKLRAVGNGMEKNIIDSAAEKHLLRVGEGGNWEETDLLGKIKCTGFNNSTSLYNLSKAMTVVTTTAGEDIILIAEQAVTHEESTMSSLIDPSAAAAANWDITINFKESSGTMQYGDYVIPVKADGESIGFYSRRPTVKEKHDLSRISISKINYNKRVFLSASSNY